MCVFVTGEVGRVGAGLQRSCSLCPKARALGPVGYPVQLSHHATPLSISLFDNYLLCCLGWGEVTIHTSLTRKHWLPCLSTQSDLYSPSTFVCGQKKTKTNNPSYLYVTYIH